MEKVNQKLQLTKAVKDARIKRQLKKLIDEHYQFYQTSKPIKDENVQSTKHFGLSK